MQAFDTVGAHVLADFWGCQFEKLDDAELLMDTFKTGCKNAKMTILGEESYKFNPQGFTGLTPSFRESYFDSYLSGTRLCRD